MWFVWMKNAWKDQLVSAHPFALDADTENLEGMRSGRKW